MSASTTVGNLTVRVDSLADLVAVKPSTRPYALVSSDDTWLSACGGVSLSVLMHAGAPVRAEMDELVQKAGGALPLAHTVVTAGGATGADRIIHAVVADWNEQRVVRQELLAQLLLRVLDHAASQGLAAVVLPALGTGRADVPFEEFLRHFRSALSEHARARTALREVILVSPWELPTDWLEELGASVREPRSPLAVAEQWSSRVVDAVERALRENLSARSVRGALDALLDAIVDRVRTFVAASLPAGISIPRALRHHIVSICIDRIEETRHGARMAPTLRALLAASEDDAGGEDVAWVSVWRDLFSVLEGLPLSEWVTLVGAVGPTGSSTSLAAALAPLLGVFASVPMATPVAGAAVMAPLASALGAAWKRFKAPATEAVPEVVETPVERAIQHPIDSLPELGKSPRAQRPGETPTSRLCDLLLSELSESQLRFVQAAVDRKSFKGDLRHRLMEYSLGEDPNILLGYIPIERRWEIARRSAGVRDDLLGDEATVRGALLAWLGFRSSPTPEGIRALRHRLEIAARKAELEQADGLVRVGEAARVMERILKTVLQFHCQAHFGMAFKDVARERWSSSAEGVDRLTLGSLLSALQSLDKALHDKGSGDAWKSFHDVYGERRLLPKGESVLPRIRNIAVHDRPCGVGDARAFFSEADALMRFFTETDRPIFPLIIRVRGVQEDDFGRRLYLAIDDEGREERLHTPVELLIGRQYHMLPLSNPVRVLPVIVASAGN